MVKERTKWIHIRVTGEERAAWQSLTQAQQLTLADLIRCKIGESQLTGRQPKRRKRHCQQADPVLIRELARIGNNLNQLARWANAYKSAAEALTVCTWLLSVQRQLTALRQQLQQATPSETDESSDAPSTAAQVREASLTPGKEQADIEDGDVD
jgi:hypothetical protein